MTGSPARRVPTDLAALAAGVTPATVRKWASRGRIIRFGPPGKAEYDLTHILEIAAENHRNRPS